MARARNIKPGFFSNDELVELPFEDRLLFIGLWTIADRSGRLLDRPKKIKMDIFPGDTVDCDAGLGRLMKAGFIIRYMAGENPAIQVVNWDKHQNPHIKEGASTIQAPDGHQDKPIPGQKKPAQAGRIPDTGYPLPDSGYRIVDTGLPLPDSLQEQTTVALTGDEDDGDTGSHDPVLDAEAEAKFDAAARQSKKKIDPEEVIKIFEYWKKRMNSPRSAFDGKRKGLIERSLALYSAEDICKAIRGCSKTPHNMGQNDRNTKFNGLDLILRNAEKIDYFIRLDDSTPKASSAVETIEQTNARVRAEFLGESAPTQDGMTIEMEKP